MKNNTNEMQIQLSDLGENFQVTAINKENTFQTKHPKIISDSTWNLFATC